MNILKRLWLQAFTNDLSRYQKHLILSFKHLKPNFIGSFLDFLIEIGAWDVLFECLPTLDSLSIVSLDYAYFRASQYLLLSSPFQHLSLLFPFNFDSSLLLTEKQEPIYAFYDYGGLGDYVDNLTRLLSFVRIYPQYFNFRLVVPDPIFTLFSNSNLKPLLIRSSTGHNPNYQNCHISHLLSFIENDRYLQISRASLQLPFTCYQEEYILFNPTSGVKNDSFHNVFSFFKRSPGSSFWSSLKSILYQSVLKPLSFSHTYNTALIRQHIFDDSLPDTQLLYSTVSQILSSKLFVTVDTFSAHLSLSLGHPTLIIIPLAYDPRWSYYLNRNSSGSDPYLSANFFLYSPFTDPYSQAFELANVINSILADIY